MAFDTTFSDDIDVSGLGRDRDEALRALKRALQRSTLDARSARALSAAVIALQDDTLQPCPSAQK